MPPGGTSPGPRAEDGGRPYAVGVSGPPAADRFVGRVDELRRIEAACAAGQAGRGSAFLVTGEPGVGKSRFCREAVDRAASAGLEVVSARGWPEGGAPPLWPWPPILDALGGPGTAASVLRPGRDPPDPFALFVEVTERLRDACTRSPACVVVDDVDAAGADALLLLRFVIRSLDRLPLVLLLAVAGAVPPVDGPDRGPLLEAIERECLPIALHPLDVEETAELLAGYGLTGLDPDLTATLLRITRGNPLHLRRLAFLDAVPAADPGGPTSGGGAGPHPAIAQAFGRLDPATRRLLAQAAVLGLTPSIAEASRLTGVRTGTVFESLAEAARAGLVSSLGPARFSFSHELVRSVAEESLGAWERLDVHARAAEVVVDPPGPGPGAGGARRAHHALLAAPRSRADAVRAVDACRDAARTMAANLAPGSAASLLAEAAGLHASAGLGQPPAGLIEEWAEATLASGRLADARPLFEQAAEAARREDDPVMLAEAALGLGGVWVNEHRAPVERNRVSALQGTALALLPAGETALRSRLHSRLAAEAVYDGGPIDAVRASVAGARRTGDARALAEALSLAHHAMLLPEHLAERLEMADELVAVASGAGLPVLSLMGLCWRAVDLFHLGDPGARRALEDLRERADAVGCLSILYIVEILDVMLLIRAGRLTEAARRSAAAYETGTAAGDVDAFGYLGAQTVVIHWLEGREADVLDLVEEAAASPTLERREFAFRATAADLAARCGQTQRAREELARLAAGGLGSLPRSSTWLTGMATIAEAAHLVGDAGLGVEAGSLLAPFASLPVMPSLGVVCLGSVERYLGLAALAAGDAAAGVAHLEAAVAANLRLGNRPMEALAHADLATALHRRARPGDAELRRSALTAAAAVADSSGMVARAEEWRRALRDPIPAPSPDHVGISALEAGAGPPAVRRRRHGWWVCASGRRVAVGDRVGFAYLARLLDRPGEEVSALSLASDGRMIDPGPRQPVLDVSARRAYAARARELGAERAAAEADADLARAERLRDEIEALTEEVERATAVGGRDRTFAGPSERARTSVRKAIVRALDELADADPDLAAWLRPRIVTGSLCSYRPDA